MRKPVAPDRGQREGTSMRPSEVDDVSSIDRAERIARRMGALAAMGAVALAMPGVIRSAWQEGPVSGRPELVFTPARLLAISLGWFGAAAAAWRPLPVRAGRGARLLLMGGGMTLYLAGLALAVAGRLALGSSYRPSSTLGVALAPDHRLVTSGPYALVRHPMYLGLAIAAIGALAIYRTWSTVLFIAQVPILVVRARLEDELLSETFGNAWRRYATRVSAWTPRPAPWARRYRPRWIPRQPRTSANESLGGVGHTDGPSRGPPPNE